MNALGLSNFDSLFDASVRDDVVKDVLEAFAEEDMAEQAKVGSHRKAAGYCNQNLPNTWNAMGMPVMRVTTDDYWRQQVAHNALGDPELWKWFLNRPEGEYARVKSTPDKLVVGWRNCRETIKF